MEGIHVGLAGRFSVRRGGQPIPDPDLGSRKARLLLKVLSVQRGHVVPTDRIVEVLWGDEPPAHPEENIAVLVSRLRGVLGRQIIEGGRGGYLLRTGACSFDVDEARRLVEQARRWLSTDELGAAGSAARAALEILERGELLEDEPYADWVQPARLSLRRVHRTARQIASTVALRDGDFEHACALAEAAIAADPLDEEAHRARMLALYRAGESGRALAAYEELRRVLGEELGADPSKESEALYLAVLRGEEVGADLASARGPEPPDEEEPGRDRELRILREAWRSARTAGPLLAPLIGEPGIGKTNISVTFASSLEATGVLVLRSRCFVLERSLFLQPFADALRPALLQVAEALSELDPDEQSMLAELLPEVRPLLDIPSERERASPEAERRRTFRGLGNLLSALARRRPVLLVLDDLHLASESTLEFLHSVVRRPRGEPPFSSWGR